MFSDTTLVAMLADVRDAAKQKDGVTGAAAGLVANQIRQEMRSRGNSKAAGTDPDDRDDQS